LYRTERILIKQIQYNADNKAFASKGDTTLFKEKTVVSLIRTWPTLPICNLKYS